MNPSISYEACKAFIDHQLKPGAPLPKAAPKPFVTISREAGAGGTSVSKYLIEFLQARRGQGNWTMFDKTLAELVLKDHALPKRIAAYMTEAKRNFIESTVEELLGLHPPIEILVQETTKTILSLAQMGNVIVVGRGANIITADMPQGFHVRLVGTLEKRAAYMAELLGIPGKVALAEVKSLDRLRRAYLRRYFHKDVDDPLYYHLVINTDHVPFKEAAEMIGEAILRRTGSTAQTEPALVEARQG